MNSTILYNRTRMCDPLTQFLPNPNESVGGAGAHDVINGRGRQRELKYAGGVELVQKQILDSGVVVVDDELFFSYILRR